MDDAVVIITIVISSRLALMIKYYTLNKKLHLIF